MKTPSQELSERVIESLIAKKLLTADEGRKILPKIASGKVSSEEWRLAIDISAEKEIKK